MPTAIQYLLVPPSRATSQYLLPQKASRPVASPVTEPRLAVQCLFPYFLLRPPPLKSGGKSVPARIAACFFPFPAPESIWEGCESPFSPPLTLFPFLRPKMLQMKAIVSNHHVQSNCQGCMGIMHFPSPRKALRNSARFRPYK